MNTKQISERLTELKVNHFIDTCNPDYTIHMINDDLINIDCIGGTWWLYSDRHDHSISKVHEIGSIGDLEALVDRYKPPSFRRLLTYFTE